MEMKHINSGKLRAIGYDKPGRVLRIELDDGSQLEYTGVGDEIWRRLSTSGSARSYYRDNIEEEFAVRKAAAMTDANVEQKPNPLDELFRK